MRDPNRIKGFLLHLEMLWDRYPDLRFFQLVKLLEAEYNNDGFYVEDDNILRTIQGLLAIAQRDEYKGRAK